MLSISFPLVFLFPPRLFAGEKNGEFVFAFLDLLKFNSEAPNGVDFLLSPLRNGSGGLDQGFGTVLILQIGPKLQP